MNVECDKCGEHALECGCAKHIAGLNDKFYYQGNFFEKEDEFWAYVKEFTHRQTTAEDFDGLFDALKKDVWMNLAIRKTEITNSEVRDLLEDVFMLILKKLHKKSVKSFDASTDTYEHDENFKKEHEALGVLMDEIHDKYHAT